jgi:hypothetical protein
LRTGRDRSMTILQFSATKAFSRRDANLLQHPAKRGAIQETKSDRSTGYSSKCIS